MHFCATFPNQRQILTVGSSFGHRSVQNCVLGENLPSWADWTDRGPCPSICHVECSPVPTNRWRTNRWGQLDTHANLSFHQQRDTNLEFNRNKSMRADCWSIYWKVCEWCRKWGERMLVHRRGVRFVTLRDTNSPDWPLCNHPAPIIHTSQP